MADEYTYYQKAGDFPFIPGLAIEESIPISGQIGLYEVSDNASIIGYYNFPYFSHLLLSSFFSPPYPDGIMRQEEGEFPYFSHLKKSYIPVLKREYPMGIMIQWKNETYPYYSHLTLVSFPAEEPERDLNEKNFVILDFINRFIDSRAGTVNSFNSTTMIGVDNNE